jgi:hypothetical protein
MYQIWVKHLEYEISSNPMAYIYKDYGFWEKLINWSLDRADTYEIRLWKTDLDNIENIKLLGKNVENQETKEVVFLGKVNDSIKNYLLQDYLTEEGCIKYFTIWFESEGDIISSLSHYGHEIVLDVSNLEESKGIKKELDSEFINVEILEYYIDEDGFLNVKDLI